MTDTAYKALVTEAAHTRTFNVIDVYADTSYKASVSEVNTQANTDII